jgi:hypothetical protein
LKQLAPEINEAIRCYKDGDSKQSRKILQDYICQQGNQYDALLWLAKVTSEPDEAFHAAELAFSLNPDNEVAARGIASVRMRFGNPEDRSSKFEVARITGMTISQARSVIWPFKGFRRPIGVLLDEKCVGLNDLGWAAQNSFDEYIMKASRTLLLAALMDQQIEQTPPPAKSIKGFNYSLYLEKMGTLKGGLYIGITVGLTGSLLLIGVLYLLLLFGVGGLLNLYPYFLLIAAFILLFMANGQANNLDRARMGREGEEKVYDIFRASLRDPWLIVRNLVWPNRKWGDIDFVLVGQSGIWVFEVKAYTREVRNIGDRWEYKSRFGWRPIKKNPANQARRNAVSLKNYLDNNGINPGWVQPVVVWVGEDDRLSVQDPAIPVWKIGEIQERFEELWRKRQLSEEQIKQVTEILNQLINKVKKE